MTNSPHPQACLSKAVAGVKGLVPTACRLPVSQPYCPPPAAQFPHSWWQEPQSPRTVHCVMQLCIVLTACCFTIPGPYNFLPGITSQISNRYINQVLTAGLNQVTSQNFRDLLVHHHILWEWQ